MTAAKTTATTKFETGKTYWTRWANDSNSILSVTIESRSARFVKTSEGRVKVYENKGVEYFYPMGQYSMAPIIRADNPA